MADINKLLTEAQHFREWTENKIKENSQTSKALTIVIVVLNAIVGAWNFVKSQLDPSIFAGYETYIMIANGVVMAISAIIGIIQNSQNYDTKIATMATSIDKFRSIENSLERSLNDPKRKADAEYQKRMGEKLQLTEFGLTVATGSLFKLRKIELLAQKKHDEKIAVITDK
jgi:hypothetical protein